MNARALYDITKGARIKMDATMESISRLYEQGISIKKIAQRLNLGEQKVRKILITTGQYTTPLISKICSDFKGGMTTDELAEKYGLSHAAICAMLPYEKGIYGAEYPTVNAPRIRKSRQNKDKAES